MNVHSRAMLRAARICVATGVLAFAARGEAEASMQAAQPAEVAAAPVSGPQAAELEAVAAELARGSSNLRLTGAPDPYRAEARFVRADLLSLDGSYGGLVTNVMNRQAIGAVEVRVGSPQRDNSNFFGGDSGVARLDVALHPASRLLRKKLWLGLDRAFRGATRAYAQKLVTLKRLVDEVRPPDYTDGPGPVSNLHAADPIVFDRSGLAAMVSSLSARFRNWPQIDNGDVHLQVLRSHETVVTTDGVLLQWVNDRAIVAVVADTKAEDGMHLDHGLALHLQGIPSGDDDLLALGEALVDRVLRELDELARAPMIEEEYDGPILFRGAAAAQFLASTVATEMAGNPAPLADGGPLMELEPAWQKRRGKVVMPPFIDLVDDPTAEGFGRVSYDAEGFSPESLSLVREGVLENLLMTRTPNEYQSGSNGRARMSPSLEVGPAISNLELRSRKRGLAPTALERELLARAREDGYEFAYVIESLRDGSILGPVPRDSAAAYAGTGKLTLPLPARVYRLDADGTRTLIRGALLGPASVRVLRRIRATGQTSHIEPMRIPVGTYGGFGADVGMDHVLSQTVDVQVRTPDLLVDGLELLVERGEHERLPTLVHPLRRQDSPEPKSE
jgi:TldD protein